MRRMSSKCAVSWTVAINHKRNFGGHPIRQLLIFCHPRPSY
jgi:hypothetical protein